MEIPTSIETQLFGRVEEWERIKFKEIRDAEASLKTIFAIAADMDNRGGDYLSSASRMIWGSATA